MNKKFERDELELFKAELKELIAVFSLNNKGYLINDFIRKSGLKLHLNCFESIANIYKNWGFYETSRESKDKTSCKTTVIHMSNRKTQTAVEA